MKNFAVIGLGQFGSSVARALSERGCQVLAVDMDEEKVQSISGFVTHAIQLDATDEKALKNIGIEDIDTAVVSVGGNLEASILITLLLKEIGIREVIAKALTPQHAKVLQKIGVDRVVFPEKEMGLRIAESLVSPNVLEQIKLSSNYEIVEITAPSGFIGKSLKDIAIRTKYKVNVIAIKKKEPSINETGETEFKEVLNLSPTGEDEVSAGDILVITGEVVNIEKLRKEK